MNHRLSPDHPFFTGILRIPPQGALDPKSVVHRAVAAGAETRQRLLDLINQAYVPICRTSPAVFDRIALLASDENVRRTAAQLRDVEFGLYPAVAGLPKTSHEALFTEMLQGIADRRLSPVSAENGGALVRRLEIESAPLPALVGYARAIEADFAPPLANAWNDFIIQWLALTGMSSGRVNWRFIDEHRLTEGTGSGDEPSAMHVDVVESLSAACGDLADDFERSRAHFHQAICEHLDIAVAAIESRQS